MHHGAPPPTFQSTLAFDVCVVGNRRAYPDFLKLGLVDEAETEVLFLGRQFLFLFLLLLLGTYEQIDGFFAARIIGPRSAFEFTRINS